MRTDEKVIVVDLGTTYFKFCRFDLSGELETVCRLPTPTTATPGRAEVSLADFRAEIARGIRSVAVCDHRNEKIVAVTFATQANSFALFSAEDQPLTPFILWTDPRAKGYRSTFRDFTATDIFRARTGVAQMDHLFMPAKLAWLQQHEGNKIVGGKRIALLSDYFTWWLTGDWCSEASTAALTGLVDIHTLAWWPEACDAAGISHQWLNRLVRSGTQLGAISADTAKDLLLPADCRFVAGCLDQHAGAIGCGNILPGGVSETTGTVLATIRCSAEVGQGDLRTIYQGPTFQEGLYYQMVFSELSAGLLERYQREKAPQLSFAQLDELAKKSPQGARGLRLRIDAAHLPASEMFENRSVSHEACDEVRAILEGVAAELSRQVDCLCQAKRPKQISCAGGGAKSPIWLQIKEQTLGIPMVPSECSEPTALGAALLAISACRNQPLPELLKNLRESF